jgi:hypothetical protein
MVWLSMRSTRHSKKPARDVRVGGLVVILESVCCLLRSPGQSRQHAMRVMMEMPGMLQLNAH